MKTSSKIVKNILSSSLLLQLFDPTRETMLLTDASKLKGIGWALLQGKEDGSHSHVECGSQSLTDTQSKYALIELECMAIF